MKTPYSEGWDAGYFGPLGPNPYRKGWIDLGDSQAFALANEWERGRVDGYNVARAERAAEDNSRKRDAREGFDD